MIVVTGAAGMIGSASIWELNSRGEDRIIAVDHLGSNEKWKNLASVKFDDYLDRNDFISKLESNAFGGTITAIIHLGACSSTTERDAGYLMENNYRYTARIAAWREKNSSCRLIYASSAATYGDGSNGYNDSHEDLHSLKPLNMYGYSKHLFDLLALRRGWLSQIAGLKYFNVYGPNEYHKGDMRSVVNKAWPTVRDYGKMSLFASHNSVYADGEQMRDFLYVKDAVKMTMFFLDNPCANGIYNVGSGRATAWNTVARAMFAAAGKPVKIEYVPIPESIRDRYQYYTCADLAKLRRAGCAHECAGVEEGISDYIQNYLEPGRHLDSCASKRDVL
jgi:ADP-L-glycero-D-manno-heptose 6-epimerase